MGMENRVIHLAPTEHKLIAVIQIPMHTPDRAAASPQQTIVELGIMIVMVWRTKARIALILRVVE